MSADTSILPSELLCTPLPLIGFAGLDAPRNPVHKTIWESFSINKKHDRALIQYKLLPPNYDFPVSKPKRQSYEWYHPKGILKKNWLLKHQHVLPAVVVLFQEMDWNDMQWSEHQLRCAAAVQSLRNSLQAQATKLCIVLLQRATSQQTAGEEQLAQERTAALASTCDINPKLIFLFPYTEHLAGYTYRLEAGFLELAQSYYTQMAKQIRVHRDQLTDAAHLTLRIRHQFKLGVIAEIRQDHTAALKNYMAAYTQLDEVRVIDTNCLEVKTIAGFLNYKICRLTFRSMPRDAVYHFKAHIEKFRTRCGFREIIFEHYAWLSLQYSAFAELFSDAIKQGLPALQTQHPGVYYHKAAEHMGRRKELFRECWAATQAAGATVAGGDATASYANQFYSEFFGVRSTKVGDAATELQMFQLVQANERNYNHSVAIISLLGQAMAQFKIYRCLRFRKKLAVDMAEEYLQCGDHSKALTLYSLMLTDYRSDKWYGVFTQVLLKTLQAARLTASVVDFLTCSLEAMSPRIAIDQPRRLAIMDNFWRVLANTAPVADPSDTQPAQPPAAPLWPAALQRLQQQQQQLSKPSSGPAHLAPIAIVDLDKLTELFEATLTFRSAQVRHDEPLHVDLFIRTRSEISFKLSSVRAVLADSTLQFTLPAQRWTAIPARKQLHNLRDDDTSLQWLPLPTSPTAAADILLQPNVCYKFSFLESDFAFPENEELRIARLELSVSMGAHTVLLQQAATLNRRPAFQRVDVGLAQCMDSLPVHATCYVVPAFHLTATARHDQRCSGSGAMLTNEYYRTEQLLSNGSTDETLRSVSLTLSVPAALRQTVFLCAGELGKQTQRLQSQLHFEIGDLPARATAAIGWYVVALAEGNIDLRQRLCYQVAQRAEGGGDGVSEVASASGLVTQTLQAGGSAESPVRKISAASAAGGGGGGTPGAAGAGTAAGAPLSAQHNMSIERLPNEGGVRKARDDVIIIPCVEELALAARFFTLNKQPLQRAYCAEDVLMRVDVEVRAPCDLDVLEMFFISDHNVTENAAHQRQQRKQFASGCTRGHKLRDVKMLRAQATSAHWQRRPDPAAANKNATAPAPAIDWKRRGSAVRLTASGAEFHTLMGDQAGAAAASAGTGGSASAPTATDSGHQHLDQADKYKSNLLAKIPANSTIIGSTGAMSSNLMSRSVEQQQQSPVTAVDVGTATATNPVATATTIAIASARPVKHVFNRTRDAFALVDHCRGFLRDKALPADSGFGGGQWPIWGVYCVRWRRTGDPPEADNESKFVIQGIEVVDPPLNIYCCLDDRMYVKVPMTLTVAIRNPTRYAMHLRTCLKNSENFMFSGNAQLNVSIFARSTYEISFNLYPLKAGWQSLPEFEVTYNTQYDEKPPAAGAPSVGDTAGVATATAAVEVNQELQHLTARWMPKKVFVLPMLKSSQA